MSAFDWFALRIDYQTPQKLVREGGPPWRHYSPPAQNPLKKQVPEQAIGELFLKNNSRSIFATCPAITIFLVVINSRNDLSRQNIITLVLRNPKSIENSSHNRLSKLDSSFGVSENCSQSVQVSFEGNPLIACSGTCFFNVNSWHYGPRHGVADLV